MKTMYKFGWLIAAMVFALSIAGPARAALIHNLSTAFGSGSITFLDESGNDPSRVAAFSFDVTGGPGSPQTYSLGDINDIIWSIDEFWELTVNLATDFIAFDGDQSAIVLTNAGVFNQVSCPDAGRVATAGSLTIVCGASGVSTFVAGLTTEAVHVPEPASLALFLLGLIGMGVVVRRRPLLWHLGVR